jgi:hypothetical protein
MAHVGQQILRQRFLAYKIIAFSRHASPGGGFLFALFFALL